MATRPFMEPLELRLLLSTTDATVTADASVRNNTYADTNFGAAPELFIQDPTAGNDEQIAFMKFDLTGISVINSATLELNGSLQTAGDPSVTAAAFAVSDTSWTEGTGAGTIGVAADGITFNTQPAIGAAISGATASVTSATPAIYDFNLTSYLQAQLTAGNSIVSIAIESSTPSADYAQFDSKEGGTAPVLVIDNTPPTAPTASLSSSNVTSAGANETVVAEYSGPAAIKLNTIKSDNLTISGAGSASIGTVSSVNSSNPDDVFATYSITPPNGSSWTTADNGNYTVSLKSNAVQDANNNFAAATSTGFNVSVDSTAPVASTPTAPNITTASGDTDTVTVVYTDNVAVSHATIGTGDITISGGPTAVNVTGVTTSPSSGDTSPITATYTLTKSNGQTWSLADDGNYTISVVGGSVQDTSNNGVAARTGSFSVDIADSTAPVAGTPTAPNITVAGGDTNTVTVVYTDNVAVSRASIDTSDITISGGPTAVNVTGVTTSPTSGDTTPITATYTVTKVNGQPWSLSDNGTYTINVVAGSVTDTSSNGVAARTGSFTVNIADTTSPVASSISAPNITVVGGDTSAVTVVYSDNVAVSHNSIATSNITISGGPAAVNVQSVATTPSSGDSSLITATYTVVKANSQPWAFADNGNYTISVVAGSVKDTSSNGVAARTGSFMVTLPQPDTTPPTHVITAPNVTAPGGATETITVVYTDNNAVNASTIDSGSLSVSGPGGTLSLSNLSKVPASNGPTVTAVYIFNAPGGAWTAADNGNYTVTLPGGHVTDTSGNADVGGTATFNVNATVPDVTPPTAVITAPNVTAPGGATEAVTAVYTDNVAVNTSTIQKSNITVTGPHGTLTVASASFTGSGKTVTATYLVDAPGGAWAATANGAYVISLAANSVQDTSANGVAASAAGFTVNATVPDTTPPTVVISAPPIAAASLLPEQIVVVYTDSGTVDAATITTSNLSVAGPDGPLTVASVTKTPAGNSNTVTATYSVTPPGAGWTASANGTYTVTFHGGQVKDTTGNASPAQSTDFVVNIPQPANPNDLAFNGGSAVSVPFVAEATAVLPSGAILVVGHQGDLTTGKSQGVIEMLNANGTVATGFGTNGFIFTSAGANEAFYSVIVQGSDFIVAGADGGFLLQRYDFTGKLDTSFGTGGSVVTSFGATGEAAYTLALNSSGDIAAGGTSAGNFAFAEYNSNGALVSSFGQGGRQLFDVGSPTDVVGKILFQPNGDLLAVGGTAGSVALVRLNTSGNADTTFGSSGLVIVPDLVANTSLSTGDRSEGLALESDGSILVANSTASGHFGLVHLDAGGNLITTFGTNGLATSDFGSSDDADAVFIQPGGSIVVLGTTNLSGTPTALAAFDQSGQPIASFGTLGQLILSNAGSGSAELVSNGSATTAFGTQNSAGYIVAGTAAQNSASTDVRRLIVPGTTVQNNGSSLGAFGNSGRKNLKLSFTLANGTRVTLALTNGSGQAYLASNGIHLVIAATAKGAGLTITVTRGARRVTLGDVTVTGTLHMMAAKTSDLAGTLFASGGLGTINLGKVVGGTVAAAGSIASLTLLSATSADILAGANLGADGELGGFGTAADTFNAGSIRNFKVAGSVTSSVISAGFNPNTNTVTGGAASIIRAIAVRSIDTATRFIAGAFKSATLGKRVKNIAADSHFEII